MGFTVSDFDLLIACVAEYHGLMILTNNRKHFVQYSPCSKRVRAF